MCKSTLLIVVLTWLNKWELVLNVTVMYPNLTNDSYKRNIAWPKDNYEKIKKWTQLLDRELRVRPGLSPPRPILSLVCGGRIPQSRDDTRPVHTSVSQLWGQSDHGGSFIDNGDNPLMDSYCISDYQTTVNNEHDKGMTADLSHNIRHWIGSDKKSLYWHKCLDSKEHQCSVCPCFRGGRVCVREYKYKCVGDDVI